MSYRMKAFIAGIILTVYILGASGCAAVWFLAGAGTAATAMAVREEDAKKKADKD